jgi:penicillin-binding protein 1B
MSNLVAGQTRQGGSTLTQQLVKNYFLTRERTLTRKIKEAWMSLLLELHYSKQEILEAYINEVFLGQDGERAIHGFGLASEFYFDKPLHETSLAEQALLVGLVKGATYYNPRRHPDRARQRRNVLLTSMASEKVISASQASSAKQAPLGVIHKPKSYRNRYLAFIDLVKRQLKRDYQDEDLRSEGLRIFTTLSPMAQHIQERAIQRHLDQLESGEGINSNSLQAAALITDTRSGEVLALSGGRRIDDTGFNRALDAKRSIGSLVKPAVFLTALSKPDTYQLSSWLDDERFEYEDDKGEIWSPQNYSKTEYGKVRLYQALSKSMNIATARLGMELGVPAVSKTLRQLGLTGEWTPYPALFLGALERSPYEVAQLYQTFAGQGFYTPLRGIREVVTPTGERLQRYPLELEQRVNSNVSYQMTWALQEVVKSGTARSLLRTLPELNVAGKTGTSNEGKDSWFAGYTGEHLGVVWVGQDQNVANPLSGSTGALPIWSKIFENLPSRPLQPVQPQDIVLESIDENGDAACKNVVQLPYIKGTEPNQTCKKGWLRRLFDW